MDLFQKKLLNFVITCSSMVTNRSRVGLHVISLVQHPRLHSHSSCFFLPAQHARQICESEVESFKEERDILVCVRIIHGMKFWLVKQEPEDYAWEMLVKDGQTAWTGVRNFQARNFLREMSQGDQVLYYHSGKEKSVVGIASVARACYPDPTATEGDWVAVDLKPVKPFSKPVALSAIKSDKAFHNLLLVRHSRLSVMPVAPPEFKHLLKLGGTEAP